jgi:hypothetical protein
MRQTYGFSHRSSAKPSFAKAKPSSLLFSFEAASPKSQSKERKRLNVILRGGT